MDIITSNALDALIDALKRRGVRECSQGWKARLILDTEKICSRGRSKFIEPVELFHFLFQRVAWDNWGFFRVTSYVAQLASLPAMEGPNQ